VIEGVSNIWMPVEDIERARNFYQNTLELPVVKDEGQWVEFDANGMRVALNGREPRGTYSEGGPVLTFQPEGGLEATVSDLRERGVEFPAGVSEHEWGRVATFKDSESNDIQLYEPPRD
jgi:predicted enzyme related to lactoylglutathione lyase